ncbi:phosphopantetheine-binding protein [Gammaproteobacteria bacterium]|nr:phosphopantetheine-binding protein [Gammaproteobacteria bacterium]
MNVKELLIVVAEALEYEDELHLDQKIEDIEEWDSLGVLSIVSMMDDLKISVNLEDLEEIKTVEDFVKLTGILDD